MFDTSIFLNLTKLDHYHLNFINERSMANNDAVEVVLELDYQTQDSFERIKRKFEVITEKYSLNHHYNELMYLVMVKNEQIRVRYDAYQQNYNDDLTSKEIAKFLLTFKESETNPLFQLGAKLNVGTIARPKTESAYIKDSMIAKWMTQLIYDKIESKDFPLGLFGEKLLYDLFGNDLQSNEPINLNKLRAIANNSPRTPTIRYRKLWVELCSYLQPYLNEQTHIKADDGVLLPDAQANLFFDILEMIGYVDSNSITSAPKDYMQSMFSKHASITTL